ncbi:MAG: hypothetical protein ACI30R_02665 [Sodaliphilus sp.]
MKKSLLFAAFCATALIASAQNPFTYGLTQSQTEKGKITISYNLNADAQKVTFKMYDINDVQVGAVELPASAITKGAHSEEVVLPVSEAGTYTWSLAAQGAGVDAAVEVGSPLPYTFWSPYGIAIDNNTESAHFGRILVTETQANMGTSYWTKSEGVGAGLYEFDPQANRVQNAAGSFGYNPLNFTQFTYTGGAQSSAFHNKKVRIAKDGRIFVGVLNTVNNPLYTVNPDNLNEWTPVFEGTIETATGSGLVQDADGNMVAAPSAAFDIIGEGADTKIVNLGSKFGQSYAFGNYTCYEYPIGEASTWNTAVAADQEVMPYSLQYTISAQSVSLAYDEDGNGIWYAQYRAAPTDAQPAIKHVSKVNGAWVEDYSDITAVARGGGIAWNYDHTLLAVPTANFLLKVYEVSEDANGKVLTEKYSITTTGIRGFNDIAFDIAGNIWSCDNGKEVLSQIQLPYPTVTSNKARANGIVEQNTCEVAAPTAQAITIQTPTAVTDIQQTQVKAQKVYENGQIFIIKGDKKYNMMGVEVK